MKIKLKNQDLSLKFLTPLVFGVCYWFYLSICFGYFLSKIIFTKNNETTLSKSIQFTKKFSLKNIIKIIINFFCKLIKNFKNWLICIGEKYLLLIEAGKKVFKAFKIYRKKVKSILKFKRNFRLLKILLLIVGEAILILLSLINEILLLTNIINWVIKWIKLIRFAMNEAVLITRNAYFLYLIFLLIFGIIIGFLFGRYDRESEINALLLFLLFQILYNNEFNDVLLEYLHDFSLPTDTVEPFSQFPLKTIEQMDSRPSKIVFKEPEQIPLPFFIIGDPFVFIETEILWDDSSTYPFELFEFYRYVDEKIKH